MYFWKNVLAWVTAIVATAALAAPFIWRGTMVEVEPLGYVPAKVVSYEIVVGKAGARRFFDLQLEDDRTLRVLAGQWDAVLVPGDMACVRMRREGTLLQGFLVPLDRCASP